MATSAQIVRLREFISEPNNAAPYSDSELAIAIDTEVTPEAAAYFIWLKKAAEAADLVNVSEGGSSRSLSNLQSQALLMAKSFAAYVPTSDPSTRSGASRTRAIVRP